MLTPTPRVETSDAGGVEETTLRSLFDSQETCLLRYAFSLVRRREVAEEIVQETFLQLHVHWAEVECPKAWLYRCVRNRAYSHFRKKGNEVFQSDEIADGLRDEQDQTPETFMARVEATSVLRKLVEELDETDRRLVTLKYFEGKRYREISEETGLSIGNVGYRLHHILKLLGQKLGPLGIDSI